MRKLKHGQRVVITDWGTFSDWYIERAGKFPPMDDTVYKAWVDAESNVYLQEQVEPHTIYGPAVPPELLTPLGDVQGDDDASEPQASSVKDVQALISASFAIRDKYFGDSALDDTE